MIGPSRTAEKRRTGPWGWLTATFPAPKPGTLAWWLENRVTDLHVLIYRLTRGRVLGNFDGAPLCILYHRGAKTGTTRRTPIIYLADGERFVAVASIGGNPRNPAWYHNLRANPDIEIETGAGRHRLRARQASEAEAAALWPRLIEIWPAWEVYMTRTSRRFPVMICEPVDPAEAESSASSPGGELAGSSD
jgi:F420H(2)-dependent quinone reductase